MKLGDSAEHVKIAVVGAGYWGPNLIRNIVAHPEALLVGVCDADPAALQRLASQYPGVPLFERIDDMLADSHADALAIATPTSSHYEHAKLALQAGLHVLVEKPATQSAAQMVELIDLADMAHRVLMVGHTFMYNNIVREVKHRIEAGELGEIQYAYSHRLNLGRFRRDTDVLWTLAPHDISILDYWLESRPHQVSARGLSHVQRGQGIADVCFALLDYPGDVSAHLHMSWLDPQKIRQMIVVGDKKMLIYDDLDPNRHIQIFDKGVRWEHRGPAVHFAEFTARLRAGDVVIPNIRLVEPLSVEMDHFVRCIQDRAQPLTDGRQGLEIVAILEGLTLSMQKEGRVVSVEYPDLAVTA